MAAVGCDASCTAVEKAPGALGPVREGEARRRDETGLLYHWRAPRRCVPYIRRYSAID